MPRTVIVVSDLHLGGEPGFQMCSPKGQALFADFLCWLTGLAKGGRDLHLVVNGDLVDFLAEKPFAAMTTDDGEATAKLRAIMESTGAIWAGFRSLVEAGVEISVLLGNHDLELTLPGPAALLAQTVGPGCVHFIFDNQALAIGDVLIEHGNRYDQWNVVDHDELRQLRSAISRREPTPAFQVPPGSKLVIDVMNEIKARMRVVDLLKPENDAVLPLLAALSPFSGRQIDAAIRHLRAKSRNRFGPGRQPLASGHIAGGAGAASRMSAPTAAVTPPAYAVPVAPGERLAKQMLQAEADEEAAGGIGAGAAAGQIGIREKLDFLHLWAARSPERRAVLIDRLYEAFRHRLGVLHDAFRTDTEVPDYLDAAKTSATRGFKVIVYGHTHLAKRIKLPDGAIYLNTGTWADLMKLPAAVIQGNKLAALGELEQFVTDLQDDRLDAWRRPLPSFARIEMDGSRLIEANVFFYEHGGREAPLPDVLDPLLSKTTSDGQ